MCDENNKENETVETESGLPDKDNERLTPEKVRKEIEAGYFILLGPGC